jgi:hypothetical protein
MPNRESKKGSSRVGSRLAIGGVVIAAALAAWKALCRTNRTQSEGIILEIPKVNPSSVRAPKPRTGGHEVVQIYLPGAIALVALIGISAVIIHTVLWDWLVNMPVSAPSISSGRWIPASELVGSSRSNAPLLQIAPQEDWQSFRQNQELSLHENAEPSAVPIEKALDQIVARGLPGWGTSRTVSPLDFQWQRATNGGTTR